MANCRKLPLGSSGIGEGAGLGAEPCHLKSELLVFALHPFEFPPVSDGAVDREDHQDGIGSLGEEI